MRRLLNEFGDSDDLLQSVSRNMHTFTWWGSRTTYYALYEKPLQELLDHPKLKVRRWAKNTLRQLDAEIDAARIEDEEERAQWEV